MTRKKRSRSIPSGVAEPDESLFRAIANFTYDWETWMDLEGRPRWVNPAVERISGYSPEECLRMDDYPMPMIHSDDRDAIRKCLDQALAGIPGNDVEFRISHKHGDERWGAVSWQSISDDVGRPIGYRTSVRDITARKHAERALRRARQAAEKANADKSHFLAAASHDLRQPLQAANMFAAALENPMEEPERLRVRSSLRQALDAANELLDALLDVSRLDSGVLKLNVEPVYLADVFEEIETEYAAQAASKGLGLTVVPSSQVIIGDFVMLLGVVRNLVSNAIRYTDAGRVLIGARNRGDSVSIEVWDTGIGIPEDAIETIFEDFKQLGNPERDRLKGLGLGLSIVRRAVHLMNMRVDVRSTPGRGSMFAITGPTSREKTKRTATAVAYELIDLSNRSALYIDDDPLQLEAVKTLLQQWGMHVTGAISGDDAVKGVDGATQRFDVIIADFRLQEGETGVDAIGKVWERLGLIVPAMILTGDTEPQRIVEAVESGLTLLHKPVSPSVLRQALCDLLFPGG